MARILALPGDGIGPEVLGAALEVLRAAADRYGVKVEVEEGQIGGVAIDACGTSLPEETVKKALAADAVLLGAVGGPKWDTGKTERPEVGLLGIRKAMGVYANLRPALAHRALLAASPLRPEILGDGLDLLIVRELTGGIYFGERGRETAPDGTQAAFDREWYSQSEVRRVARVAFEAARGRGGRLCSVDKANVLESSRLWRETVTALAAEYPDVALSHLYVDNAAMQLACNPKQFDVIVTGNLFGDILSDEASVLTGSIGLLPSASLGDGTRGLYEPIHGSAPDIAGKGVANPLATILSVAMMFRYSLERGDIAEGIERAVTGVLDAGLRTADIARSGEKAVGTKEMTGAVLEAMAGA